MTVQKTFFRLRRLLVAFVVSIFALFTLTTPALAVPDNTTTSPDGSVTVTAPSGNTTGNATNTTSDTENVTFCTDESDAIGWLVCPGTGVIAKAIDGVYSVINDFLIIEPLPSDSSSPIRIIWNYVKDLTNIVFIIFILIVIYSQITGIGLSNYGIKRVLPKIIVAAILMNLSYYICQLAVDISNVLGNSLRGFLMGIESDVMAQGATLQYSVSWTDLTKVFLGTGTAAALGITLAGGGAALFWALLPVLIGGIVSVFIGLVTIALRQGVVMLLAMIAPLAMVCYLLPNTESWFKKWKDMLIRMVVFFPAFSFLYGASHLAGWAIISTSESAFGIIIGLAVQIYPLFASWSLMKMSGSILGNINSKLHGLAARPLGALAKSSASKAAYHRAKFLGEKPRGISQDVLQRVNDKTLERAIDTKRYQDLAIQRGTARAAQVVDEKGHISRRAERIEADTIRSIQYQTQIARGKNDLEKGLSQLENVNIKNAQMNRLNALDSEIVKASDSYKHELARGALIEYRNTVGFNERTQAAINAHMDQLNAGRANYQTHQMADAARAAALERYGNMTDIFEGHTEDVHFAAANAAQVFAAQAGSIQKKYQTYFDLTAPTQDVIHNLSEITRLSNSTQHIDEIIAGLRTLNMRGDTDLVKDMLDETLIDVTTGDKKVRLGTYASQSLANFLMFDVKGADPFLRRFGKYINLETARVYNEADPSKRRHNDELTFDEYITGDYTEYDENGNPYTGHSKRTAKVLLEGTSFKDIERTGYANMIKSITKACTDENGHVDHEKSEKLQDEIYNATLANLIGDSLSYLSGSEQITSFAQFISGIKKDKDGRYVEDFLDLDTSSPDFQNMTPEEQQALLDHKREYYKKRTDLFNKSQVPSQIGRYKSDIFAGTRQLYRNIAEGNLTDAEHRELDTLLDITATPLSDKDQARYDSFATDAEKQKFLTGILDDRKGAYLDEHGAKKLFKDSIRPKTYEYLQKQYKQGRLGDSKAPISAYLDIDTFAKDSQPQQSSQPQPAPQPVPQQPEDEDEENGANGDDDLPEPSASPADINAYLGEATASIDDLFTSYNTPEHRHDVEGFLTAAIDTLSSYNLDPEIVLSVESLSRSVRTMTDVSVIHAEIINILNNYS